LNKDGFELHLNSNDLGTYKFLLTPIKPVGDKDKQ
jgi:hypothetical protein